MNWLIEKALAADVGTLVPCIDNCDYNYLINLIDNVIHFFVYDLGVPVATIAIVYAGIIMVTKPDDPAKLKQGKEIMMTAVIGLIIMLGGYLIITTIFKYLTGNVPAVLKG